TSRALRVLGQYPVEGGRMLRGISLTPDRRVVYFGYGGWSGACENAIYRAPVDGGRPPEKVVEGWSPKLSPDGRMLAYAAAGSRFGINGFLNACSNVLVVRDLATGAERAWLPSANDNYFSVGGISSITWAPDSKRLAFEFAYEETAVYLVESVDSGGRLEDLEPVPGDNDLFAPSWRPDGKIVVGSVCCQPEFDQPRKTFLVDPDARTAVPFTGADDFSFLDFDSTGRHELYVRGGEKGELFRRSDGGVPVFMARDFLEADW
ncbi:MAG: hypothetical protein KY454_11660, partial [Actinobacteria bacterium]|nr:hypothetical protein [Actinomycetota bacterium]